MCTIDELRQLGLTRTAIEGGWRRIARGVYGEGLSPATTVERAFAAVIVSGGVASGRVAAFLQALDCPAVCGADFTVPPTSSGRRRGARRRLLPPDRVVVVAGLRCTDGLQTVLDLAADLDDLQWEQLLESALRKRLTTIVAVEAALDEMARARTPGTRRARRVLALRPAGAPPTESLLETLMVQLIRARTGLPEPVRQFEVYDRNGNFVARVDLAWPELGIFIELDGQGHKGQPVYDAARQTAVVKVTGWLVGRFTWYQVTRVPRATARDLCDLAARARAGSRRPAA